ARASNSGTTLGDTMKTFPITEGPQFAGDRSLAESVNARLPKGIRWSPATRELVSDNLPIEDREPLTAADIDWAGLNQELGEESSLTVGSAVLIEELTGD